MKKWLMSAIVRALWDDRGLKPLGASTKSNRCYATGPHINLLCHITIPELQARMDTTDAYNGFLNRFIVLYNWECLDTIVRP